MGGHELYKVEAVLRAIHPKVFVSSTLGLEIPHD